MRVVALNPDAIGDFVLRTPAFNALLDRGFEVSLAVRDMNMPLVRMYTPRAKAIQYPCNPYGPRFNLDSAEGQQFLEGLRQARPDLLAFASFQYTQFEIDVADRLPGVRCAGFDGLIFKEGFPPFPSEQMRKRLNPCVTVAQHTLEIRKNERLCAAILGEGVTLPAPSLQAPESAVADARIRLRSVGLDGQSFWAVCAGDLPHARVKNWEYAKWAELLAGLVHRHSIQLLFVGSQDEHEVTNHIRSLMGDAASRTASLTGEPGGLESVVGVLELSRGYIGKDTGPMHIAASLGKPVVSVFGAGDWPRFVPAARIGRTVTMVMPCAGCSWCCHLEKSHCVKDVPVDVMARLADLVVSGECKDFQAVELQPDALMSAATVRQSWERSWNVRRAMHEEWGRFNQWHSDRLQDIEHLKAALAVLTKERNALAGAEARLAELSAAVAVEREKWASDQEALEKRLAEYQTAAEQESELVRRADSQLAQLEQNHVTALERAREEANQRFSEAAARSDRELVKLRTALTEAVRHRDDTKHVVERLKAAVTEKEELRARLDSLESESLAKMADLEITLQRSRGDLNTALRVLPQLRSDNAELRRQLDALADHEEIALQRQRAEFDVLEADRVNRGQQIEALHEHIASLNKAFDAYKGRLALRVLRIFGLA
ncbi:MAG: hypothetical protein FJW30_23605 [Acidobacteria bacterium]|nr:hypothetical protein [Acidobacteriota bacterium]